MKGLIGGIGLTHLTVYNQRPAPDGQHSGCAHVHAITDEAYFVISGKGAVELHDLEHGFRSVPLSPGSYVQFAPGTLHRAVNGGNLVVLGIMGNAGLAERGDARIWFGPEADADPALYQELWTLPARKGLDGALERRDRSVSAYMKLIDLWNSDRPAYRKALADFVDLHARTMAPMRERLQNVVQEGPASWLQVALARIDGLPSLIAAPQAERVGAQADPKWGMCGVLRPLDVPAQV
ncbi:MAG: cupin domain-containing protein [Pseudorhodoplanes sp.]|nr:cupin domain-containing protein [Pseudorhodoplanes sp.]